MTGMRTPVRSGRRGQMADQGARPPVLLRGEAIAASLWGIAAGVLLGIATAGVVWIAGGSLGDGALAEVGAPPLATGLAVGAQAAIAAAIAAAVSRWRAPG